MKLLKVTVFEGFDLLINPEQIINVSPIVKQKVSDEDLCKEAGVKMEIVSGKTRVKDSKVMEAELKKYHDAVKKREYLTDTDNPSCMIHLRDNKDVKVRGTLDEVLSKLV